MRIRRPILKTTSILTWSLQSLQLPERKLCLTWTSAVGHTTLSGSHFQDYEIKHAAEPPPTAFGKFNIFPCTRHTGDHPAFLYVEASARIREVSSITLLKVVSIYKAYSHFHNLLIKAISCLNSNIKSYSKLIN